MDPVTVFVLIVAGIIVVPKVLPIAALGLANLGIKIYDKIKEVRKNQRKKSKKYQKINEEKEAVYKSLIKDHNMEFTSIDKKTRRKFNVTEIVNFDEKKDKLYHGKLVIKGQDGKVIEDDIYLFQPRVYANDVLLGPCYTKKGSLSDKFGYTAKIPGTNEYFTGYVPKREFMSGRQFDYVNSSIHNNSENIKQFINIVIPQDESGNYIPVDLSDKKELESLRQYVIARTEYGVDPDEYLDSRLKMAEESYQQWKIDTRPKYAEPIREVSEEEIKKVEKARKARESRENMQKRYYQWLAMRPPQGRYPSGMHYGPMHHGPMRHVPHGPMGGPMMPPPMTPPVNIDINSQGRTRGR